MPETDIADDIPIPIIGLDPEQNRIIWANQATQEWLGTSLRKLKNETTDNQFKDFEEVLAAVQLCGESLAPVSLYDFLFKREGFPVTRCDVTVFPTGSYIGIMFKPDSKRPDTTRSGGQATSAMGRMLAHEIKNPLAGIHGAAQLLREDVSTDEGQGLIDLIGSEISRIQRLADRMETLGDHDPDNLGSVNIHQILRKSRQIVASASSEEIVFTEHYDPSLPNAHGDADTLMQAVLNLIVNATESISQSGSGGEIRLETAFRSGVKRYIPGQSQRQHLPIEIRVIDDGPGISDSVRNRLFEPFITNKPTGQGLGLALVSKVANAHGGLVEAQSRDGLTIFSLRLPVPEMDPTDEI